MDERQKKRLAAKALREAADFLEAASKEPEHIRHAVFDVMLNKVEPQMFEQLGEKDGKPTP